MGLRRSGYGCSPVPAIPHLYTGDGADQQRCWLQSPDSMRYAELLTVKMTAGPAATKETLTGARHATFALRRCGRRRNCFEIAIAGHLHFYGKGCGTICRLVKLSPALMLVIEFGSGKDFAHLYCN